jgi:hypothetical protein
MVQHANVKKAINVRSKETGRSLPMPGPEEARHIVGWVSLKSD